MNSKSLYNSFVFFASFSALYSSENLIKNGSFEELDSRGVPAGWICDQKKKDLHGIDNSYSVDGKNSMKIGPVVDSYDMISLPMGLIKDFKGSYKLSAWIKAENIVCDKPQLYTKPIFGIWTYTSSGKNSTIINIFDIQKKNINWTKFERIITEKDIARLCDYKTEEKKPFTWCIVLNLNRQPGTVWIDDIRLEKVETPPFTVTLAAQELTTDSNSLAVIIDIANSEKIPQPLRLVIFKGADPVVDKTVAVKPGRQTENLSVNKLGPGEYSLKLLSDKNEELCSNNFKIIEGAF